MKYGLTLTLPLLVFFFSCSVSKQIAKSAKENVFKDDALQTAHVGISIYEPATGKYWYNYQGDRYFVPASNTKLPTCYAAMKYLGDSLVGARVAIINGSILEMFPSADPTFLHPDFKTQPVFKFLKQYNTIRWYLTSAQFMRWGNGWSWNDYDGTDMKERSSLPIYGNQLTIFLSGDTLKGFPVLPSIWFSIVDSIYNGSTHTVNSYKFSLERNIDKNQFYLRPSNRSFSKLTVPFRAEPDFISKILNDTLKADNISTFGTAPGITYDPPKTVIHSQPTDSLLKPMMHRSDNFFAEQSLLMVSNELLGVMNDAKIIDTLLKTDFKDLPQKPRWVDGSGLSRYNLFTPQDFVFILNKMKTDFGMDRIKTILPTGNEGTLSSRFVRDSNYIFAKTGTLSGVVSLSGFLYTKKNKLLVFSVLVNNHNSSASQIRSAVEKFIDGIRQKY
ncbi:MAG TPA: D-alanyl-D-alanine carboxypeptidase [Flavisolibacter sp.]|nr:D-alanyl-D-alanine carboxypeptidase [Flavisolibacter sp.]